MKFFPKGRWPRISIFLFYFSPLFVVFSRIPAPDSLPAQEIRVLLQYWENPPADLEIGHENLRVQSAEYEILGSSENSVEMAGGGLIYFSSQTKNLYWRGEGYPGRLEALRTSEGRIALVNVVDLEEYLYKVIPNEMEAATWPMEALKTQAVVSRSYALHKIASNDGKVFDAGAGSNHQVYQWMREPSPRAIEAVDETRDEVLIDKTGAVVAGYFHSCCGGRSEDVSLIWGGVSQPGLVGVSDFGACSLSPHYSWVTTLPFSDLDSALNKLGFQYEGAIKGFYLGEVTGSQRVVSFKVVTQGSSLYVPSAKLRDVLGPNWLKSTRITAIARKKDRFVIYGKGWGHGVGLCQWGARGMALKHADYRKILKRYFPKAFLGKIEEL